MNQQLTTYQIPFHAETLLVLEDHLGDRFVVLRPIVEALGLNWSGQYLRLNRHPVLSTCVCMMQTQVPGDDQQREVVSLPIEQFHGWLFTIDASRVKPEIQEKLLAYQVECFDVLHSYFTEGAAWNPRFHRQEFDRTRKIAGKQTMDMAPVAFSAISRAAERVAPHQCVEFAHQALDLANQCLARGEPDPHAQEHLLKLILSTGETLHPDEVSALTRTTPTQRGKLLRQLDAAGFQVRKNLDGHYEHVKPVASNKWLVFGDPDLEGEDGDSPSA